MRRLDRKRLHEIEKLGQNVDVSTSDVMKNALISATQHREGQKLTTDMVFDFGASGAGLLTKSLGVGDVVGTADASYLCIITDAVFGVVSKIESVTLEAISDGTLIDYDLMYAGDGALDGHASSGNDGALGANATGEVAIQTGMGTLGKHTLTSYHAEELKNKHLYLTSGAATTQKASATIDCSGADHTKVVSGITRIRLSQHDATFIDVVADSGKAKADTYAGFFGTSDVGSAADLALSLKNGIGATSDASGTFATSNPTATTVLVTNSSVSATSNNSNFLVDDPQSASLIEVPAMTGGIDTGVAITSGKLLVRVTGFLEPSSL